MTRTDDGLEREGRRGEEERGGVQWEWERGHTQRDTIKNEKISGVSKGL